MAEPVYNSEAESTHRSRGRSDLGWEPLAPRRAASSGLRILRATLSVTLGSCLRSCAKQTVAVPPTAGMRGRAMRIVAFAYRTTKCRGVAPPTAAMGIPASNVTRRASDHRRSICAAAHPDRETAARTLHSGRCHRRETRATCHWARNRMASAHQRDRAACAERHCHRQVSDRDAWPPIRPNHTPTSRATDRSL